MARSTIKYLRSKRWCQLIRSRLLNLGSMKFSWRIVMIVEILIIGLVSYWICRDPRELREYEEAFLSRYVYPHKDISKPIPSAFHNQTELISKLCHQFVMCDKTPRIAVRLLGFKKAIHKPVPIEVVKCGRGVGLVQAPGHNSFYILHKGKKDEYHETKVFNIYRKAFYRTRYEFEYEKEEYERRTMAHPRSFNDMPASHNQLAGLSHSYSASEIYGVDKARMGGETGEQFPRTVITSDLAARNFSLHDPSNGFAEDCQPRLAVRSPRQYHSLSDVERYGISLPTPSKMDSALKFLKGLFSKNSRTRRHRSERARTSALGSKSDPSRLYRSKSAPRNFPTTRNHIEDVPAAAQRAPHRDSQGRQLQPAYQYPATSRTIHPQSKKTTFRSSSPPYRKPNNQYDLRVRLSQSDEGRRRASASSEDDRYAVRHIPPSKRDDVRQVTLPSRTTMRQEYKPLSMTSAPPPPRHQPNHEDFVRQVRLPPAPSRYHESRPHQKDGRYHDYIVGGAQQAEKMPYAYPYHPFPGPQNAIPVAPARDAWLSHPAKVEERLQPPLRNFGGHAVGTYMEPTPRRYPEHASRQQSAAAVKDSRSPAAQPFARATKQATRGSSTCQTCHSVVDRSRQAEAGVDRRVRTQVSSDARKNSSSAEKRSVVPVSGGREGRHGKSSAGLKGSSALRDNRMEVSSTMAETGSTRGLDRFEAEISRRGGGRRVPSVTVVDDDEEEEEEEKGPRVRARSVKGGSALKRYMEQMEVTSPEEFSSPSEDDHPSSRLRRSRSTPARNRSNSRWSMLGERGGTRDAARRKVSFAVSVDGEPPER